MMQKVAVLTFCLAASLVLVRSESEPRRCSFFRKGFVCAENLRAYYECDGSNPFGEYKACGANEICSCGKNRKCPDNKPLCVPRPMFGAHIVPQDFTVTFDGEMVIVSPGGRFVEYISGTVRQSLEPGKEAIAEQTTYRNEKDELIKIAVKITKKENGRVVQHEYHKFPRKENGKVVGYHESCTSNVKRNFVSFFEDLSKFSYKDHKMLKTYVYRDGPAFPQAGFTVKRWTFGSTHHSQPNVPVKFVKVRQSSPIGKTNSVLTINFQYYWTFRPAQAFFRPIVCPPRKQKRSVADEIEKELDENFAALL